MPLLLLLLQSLIKPDFTIEKYCEATEASDPTHLLLHVQQPCPNYDTGSDTRVI